MTAPIIGITAGAFTNEAGYTRQQVNDDYVQSVIRAGGIPVLIPTRLPEALYNDLLERVDGFLFTGGPDLDPVLFHGEPHPSVYGIDAERDNLELVLVKLAAQVKKPFLGVCRGVQVINVALGGTLYTDIEGFVPGALRHDYNNGDYPRNYRAHPVTIEPESMLANVCQAGALRVNSFHHQAIKDLAPRLRATAFSPDHLVEAVELPDHPFGLGVQWHPEGLPEDRQVQAVFRALVEACAKQAA